MFSERVNLILTRVIEGDKEALGEDEVRVSLVTLTRCFILRQG